MAYRFRGSICWVESDKSFYLFDGCRWKQDELRQADPNDNITKVAGASYSEDALAPLFKKVINEIFKGDEEVIEFVRRLFGLCLSGEVPEHIFPLL